MKAILIIYSVLLLAGCSSAPKGFEEATNDSLLARKPAANPATEMSLSPSQQCSRVLSAFKTGTDFSSVCNAFQSSYSVSALLLVLSGDSLGMASTFADLASLYNIKTPYSLLALESILEERRQPMNSSAGWSAGLTGKDFEQISRVSTLEQEICLRKKASASPNSCPNGDELTNFYFCRVEACIGH